MKVITLFVLFAIIVLQLLVRVQVDFRRVVDFDLTHHVAVSIAK